ncbi:tRNA epoxyqueuosine(34) reductase QueG [Glaciecola sp. 33A]|jgi:epoxyqueuosine reductase|uniref:tRNA epoxyqueuosine(34) reductase QueG n=1 Tax=Glaciecola sp. 33A TaxID=2057807 RepID=UPI000C33FB4B|nr:tRNA epoxyqueuosine(34) reductase QueG [Glaciecola sp. 33A]PKI02865.1 tRNA epoxyqueuosine(34) reductase QueG [Glaciecola sp. 33A]
MSVINSIDLSQLTDNIKTWGKSLGFQQIGISDVDLSQHEKALKNWLENDYQGSMSFLERNVEKRLSPNELVPGTLRIISVRMDYLPPDASFASNLKSSSTAYISRYALGRDYHKVIRKKLQKLAEQIQEYTQDFSFRPFVDSAPVLEHAIAEKAGLGWTGKHSLTINKEAGSYFFLGELFINLPLPVDQPVEENCGKCTACISICPTQAIVAPYVVDARKCISYLTIENDGEIPIIYRKAIGNRVYGCDDCQLVCPWNKYAKVTEEKDFFARQHMHNRSLLDLFKWTENEFLKNTEGSAIRRIGYRKWKRNIAVGLGNQIAKTPQETQEIKSALENALDFPDEMVQEHIQWALAEVMQSDVQPINTNVARNKEEDGSASDGSLGKNTVNRKTQRLARSVEKGMPKHK